MSGSNCFESNIGEDGVERWKYVGVPMHMEEKVEIPFVGGFYEKIEYSHPSQGMQEDGFIIRVKGHLDSNDERVDLSQYDQAYQYDSQCHVMRYIGLYDDQGFCNMLYITLGVKE